MKEVGSRDMIKDVKVECDWVRWLQTQQKSIKRSLCSANPQVLIGSSVLVAGAAASLIGYLVYQKYYKPGAGHNKQRKTIKKLLAVLKPDNSNVHTILRYFIEKSAFKDEQDIMIEEKVIERIEEILFDFDDPEIRQMLRLVTNLSTNPKAIPALKVLIPRTNGLLLKYRVNLLGDLLGLYVNLSSHEELVITLNMTIIPYVLATYTKMLQNDIILKCLKILINATLSHSFSSGTLDLDQVVVSLLRILYECKNTTVTLRALTLLRNMMNNSSISKLIDEKYHQEIMECVQHFMSENNVDSLHL